MPPFESKLLTAEKFSLILVVSLTTNGETKVVEAQTLKYQPGSGWNRGKRLLPL